MSEMDLIASPFVVSDRPIGSSTPIGVQPEYDTLAHVTITPADSHSPTSRSKAGINDGNGIMERWKEFFGMTDRGSDEKKNLYAISKLTQIALVQYMKLRGVYPDQVFVKESYSGYEFFMINTEDEQGAKLNQTVNATSRLITLKAAKTIRFQLFHKPEKPDEIGEELYFLFHYGNNMRVEMDFDDGDKVEIDMTDCSFESFVECFADIIGKIRCYCAHLIPLPSCEKHFRVSLCKKIPGEVDTGLFDQCMRSKVCYAPGMHSNSIGSSKLDGVCMASILRTVYFDEEVNRQIEESMEEVMQEEIDRILDA